MTPSKMRLLLIDCLKKSLANPSQPVRVPDGGRLIWHWFNALCRTRSSNGYGPNPITHAEFEAYARLYRWPLEPRHVDMILAMDRVWMDHARATAGLSPKSTPATGGQEMTPEAFDAVFG